jgi:hypothetical protein
MNKVLLFVWLLLPVGALAYHYGPGQTQVSVDRAARATERAQELTRKAREVAAKDGDEAAKTYWLDAETAYAEALGFLPVERVAETRALRLQRAKAQMFISQLPDARRDLGALVEELSSDPAADPKLLAEARSALGNAQYYTTWLMRLEGLPQEVWEPEIEASRQNYKLLAEQAAHEGDGKLGQESKENLESAIRLARMDLSDLQGLPLPSQ